MKVLFVRNTAGACTPIAIWLRKNGHEARVLDMRIGDRFGRISLFDESLLCDSPAELKALIKSTISDWRPDVIHVNYHDIYLVVCRTISLSIPIVFQFHGSDIRGKKKLPINTCLADAVIVSTPDLSEYGEWYGSPTADIFTDKGGRERGTGLLIYDPKSYIDEREAAKAFCHTNYIDLTIAQNTPHKEMPQMLSKFEYYLDFKRLDALSKIALEAASCGCHILQLDSDGAIWSRGSADVESYQTSPEKYLRLYESLSTDRFRNLLKLIRVMGTRQNIGRLFKYLKRRLFG